MRPLGFLALFLVACGGGGSSDSPAGDASADTSLAEVGDEGVAFDVDAAPMDAGALGCSSDLRSVVDATGMVVMNCPPEQGCAKGACIDACAAAKESKGNVGCDFWIPTPPIYPYVSGPPCFAVFVANTWPKAAKLTVTRDGTSFDASTFGRLPVAGKTEVDWTPLPSDGIPVDDVVVLFLSSDPASKFPETGGAMTCPIKPAVDAATVVAGSGTSHAFHIVSSYPVSAYDIAPYGAARSHFPSAQLLFPSNAWGTNYVVLATPKGTDPGYGPLWGQILAAEADTKVQILPVADLPAAGAIAAAAAKSTASFSLGAGEYVQWELAAGQPDLSGSVVVSDKPVSVLAGNRFFRQQPMSAPGGESTHQTNIPVSALSREYAIAPYASRFKSLAPEEVHYRVVGTVDGTSLTYDPPIASAPAKLDRSTVADFTTAAAFRVTSQDSDHPIAIAQIMDTANGKDRPGAVDPMYANVLGDEEFLVMLPPQQFLKKYVFFTDPTYATTNMVLTRVKGDKGFSDVIVDCIGAVTGWKPLGTSGLYEFADVDLMRAFKGVGSCTNGRHTASSAGAFGLVVWGLDAYSSYAYPGGGTAAALTKVVVPAKPK